MSHLIERVRWSSVRPGDWLVPAADDDFGALHRVESVALLEWPTMYDPGDLRVHWTRPALDADAVVVVVETDDWVERVSRELAVNPQPVAVSLIEVEPDSVDPADRDADGMAGAA